MAVKNYGIHDKWTDLDKLNNVDIKSVDGVIESVKINGEEAGGGGGSSDLSTAEVTFICSSSEPEINFAFINVQNDGIYSLLNIIESTQTVTVPLYKNKLSCGIPPFYMSITSTSGSITGTQMDGYIISGDCTINYTLPN